MLTAAAIQRLFLVLMVGTLWVIGYVVAPTLFAFLSDDALAGSIAGRMFRVGAWVELGAGFCLLLSALIADRRMLSQPRYRLVLFMLVMVIAIQFGLNPVVEQARGSESFGVLHGVSAFLYLTVSALGLLLVLTWEPNEGKAKIDS